MKKILSILLIALTGIIVTGCNNNTTSETSVTDNDGSVYESFTTSIGFFQSGYCEGWSNGDNNSAEAKTNTVLTLDKDVINGKGSLKIVTAWTNSDSGSAKSYVSQFSNGGDNVEIIDGTGKTMVVKIKVPTGFIDGFDSDTAVEGIETYTGIKLYIKGSDWAESSLWIGSWNIEDALNGNDQSAAGITLDSEDGFVLLKAKIGTDIKAINGENNTIYECGIVFEQNGDTSLTDDLEFYIDYIDFE